MDRYITTYITHLDSEHISKNDTGLGNNLFQVASIYGIAKTLNIKCTFPKLQQYGNKLLERYNHNQNNTIFKKIIEKFNNKDVLYEIILGETLNKNKDYDIDLINSIKYTLDNTNKNYNLWIFRR